MDIKDRPRAAIFVSDQGFGWLREDPRDDGNEVVGIDLPPETTATLQALRQADMPLALLVPRRLSVQSKAVLKQHLPQFAMLLDGPFDAAEALAQCTKRLKTAPGRTLFVASDRVLRGVAASQGYAALPHPAVAALAAQGVPLSYVELRGPRESFNRLKPLVPYAWERLPEGGWRMLAIASQIAIDEAAKRGMLVTRLPLDFTVEDVLRVRRDAFCAGGKELPSGFKVLLEDNVEWLVALPSTVFNDDLAVSGAHGSIHSLTPSPELLREAQDATVALKQARSGLGHWPPGLVKAKLNLNDFDTRVPILPLCPGSAVTFQADVDRYRGAANLDGSGAIVSRHIRHADNARAVAALVAELANLGYCTWTHSFSHGGTTYQNVIAQLPGTGYLTIAPDVIERVRQIFLRFPLPDPPEPWLRALSRILGAKWLRQIVMEETSPKDLRTKLELVLQLKPWHPWWRRGCRLPGLGAQIVLVGCHLDSSANYTPGYDPPVSPAPGADDDASGIAALLGLARWLSAFRGKLKHSVRLCLFNAEEQGMVGSMAYAAHLKALGAPLKAAVCLDMIGYNSDAADIFEIHAGYTDPLIRDASVPLANAIASWANCVGSLDPQIYRGTLMSGGADRAVYDPAINRSDHAAFHQQGYPAVVVSEDYFVNLPTEPGADPNPYYHTVNDATVDASYAADITCAVAYAIVELAAN